MSRPHRVKALLVMAFALTLAAGVVAGIGFARVAPDGGQTNTSTRPTTQPQADKKWFGDQLNLTPEQRDQVAAIWRDVPHEKIHALDSRKWSVMRERDSAVAALYTPQQKTDRERVYREYDVKMSELRHERDETVEAIYSPDQKAKKDQLKKDYDVKSAEVTKERDRLLQPLIEKTQTLLNEDQRKRFDGMMRGGGRRGGPPMMRSGSTQPTSRPSGQGNEWPRFEGGGRNEPGRGDSSSRGEKPPTLAPG